MGLLVMTNPQLGSSFCLETTKLTSSSCGFGSKTNMNANKKRSGRVFVMRKEESEKRLVLEKELEFKPSFNEYLKALDSVKTARDTKPKLAHDKPTTYSSDDGLNENVKLSKFDVKGSVVSKSRDGSKDDLKENVKLSRFDEKGSVVSKSRDAKVKKVFRGETSNGRSLLYQRDSGVKDSHFDKGATFRNASRDDPFRSNTTTSVDTRGKLVYDQNSSKMVGFGTKGKSSFEREKVGVRSWGRGTHGSATPERNLVRGQKDTNENEIESRGGNLVNSSKSFRRKGGDDSSWEVERAAFNSLEEDNDIMDKPRVSKVEMEERIQNLARR